MKLIDCTLATVSPRHRNRRPLEVFTLLQQLVPKDLYVLGRSDTQAHLFARDLQDLDQDVVTK